MKNILLAIVLLFPLLLAGQTWFQTGDRWNTSYVHWSALGYHEIVVAGDTVINDTTCIRLSACTIYYDQADADRDTLLQRDQYFMFEKDRQVFEWRYGRFQMVYDFNLQAGDSLEIQYDECGFPLVMEIIRVDTIDVFGQDRIRQWAEITFGNFIADKRVDIIEGIGITRRYFDPTGAGTNDGHIVFTNNYSCISDRPIYNFYCFNRNGLIYNPDNEDCPPLPKITSTNQADQFNEIKVWPNPAEDYLVIKMADFYKVKSVQISDLNGRSIQIFRDQVSAIPIQELTKGVYFIRFQFPDYSYTQKFIKM